MKMYPGWFLSFSSKAKFESGNSVDSKSFNSALRKFNFSFSLHSGVTLPDPDRLVFYKYQ